MRLFTLCFLLVIAAYAAYGQEEGFRISGNFQTDAQYYTRDTLIGAENVKEKTLSNNFLYLNLSKGIFNAGIRYEAYMPGPLLGFDNNFAGNGIAYRYIELNTDIFSATAGNFYEQFGNGLILRSYEERQIGIDNALDGVRFKFKPIKGIELTGLIGKQRNFWSVSDGIVRGGDLNFNINDIFGDVLPGSMNMILGGSVVSRYQQDNNPFYNLPENVLAYSTRLSVNSDKFTLDAEYAYKYNDPNATNKMNFNPGSGLLISTSYFISGFGISLDFHRLDNMDFRTDRDVNGNMLTLSYFPPLTKQHTYALATVYPYATQPNGEIGGQIELTYSVPKGTLLGGEYGTTFNFNYSRINSLDTTNLLTNEVNGQALTYESKFPGFGNRLYFQEFNLEMTKKWSKDFKSVITAIYETTDRDILEEEGAPTFGKVNAFIAVADLQYKISQTNTIRMEFQHLLAKQDSVTHIPEKVNGNWLMFLAEYTVSPSWFFSVYDQWNYGNEFTEKRLHYPNISVAYLTGSTRVSLGFGRQRAGLICVGGVCRTVPAATGLSLSVTSSF